MTPANIDTLFDRLFPINRSITGPGLRESLDIFSEYMPLELQTIPSGSEVYDWTIPDAWNMKGAVLTGPDGEEVVNFKNNNLHVVNYSEPVDLRMDLDELKAHLHTLPSQPKAIPYVTSYYKRSWGFCMSHEIYQNLKPGTYHAKIDSEFLAKADGVHYGDCTLEDDGQQEIVLSSYLCHPSMANNELSGPLVLLRLYEKIKSWSKRRYSYRFILNPETIGSLCYLKNNADYLRKYMLSGMVLTCLGGNQNQLSYKMSRKGDSLLDKLLGKQDAIALRPFLPHYGSDERQYCAPGFNLPMGQMSRTIYGMYPGYHNSLDTKEFMQIKQIEDSSNKIEQVLQHLEYAGTFENLKPYGEPQLGKYGLYPNMNSEIYRQYSSDSLVDSRIMLNRILTVLNYSDETHSMIDISEKCECSVAELAPIIDTLEQKGLLHHKN